MALPFDLRDLVKTGTELKKARQRPLRLQVLCEVDVPEPLLQAAEAVLTPSMATARVDVDIVDQDAAVDDQADAVVFLTGPAGSERTSVLAVAAVERAIPTAAVGLGADRTSLSRRTRVPLEDVLVSDEGATDVLAQLSGWLVDRIDDKRLALAANFPFLRRAVALQEVKSTAVQNTFIGVAVIIPGADMPIMTLNQAKMLLRIGAAYGQPLGADRVKELAAIVGGGFLLRSVARQVVTVVPGLGWVVKGGIAYGGTMAMGRAAVAYFEEGADILEVGRKLAAEGRRRGAGIRGAGRRALQRRQGELPPATGAPGGDDGVS